MKKVISSQFSKGKIKNPSILKKKNMMHFALNEKKNKITGVKEIMECSAIIVYQYHQKTTKEKTDR